ncbi:MAG TPA: LLM class flavin-dependent oxidoreductase [Acidimicrobiales bacterium]|nr:LLM class flavin-dependent oxidoreductase [Acidimicrobiales bacterium]
MRFSIWPAANQSWGEILATASYAEATGWDGVWMADHFMPNAAGPAAPDGPTLEATSLVAALAAAVSRLRIGTLVLGNTYRHPAVVANLAATVDHVSGGRFTLGLGAGWQVNEHEVYGIELPAPGPRIDRFAESIEVIHGLLRNERTTFKGRYYQLTDAPCDPKPIQEALPILVGTSGNRMLGIAARWADAWNTWGTPDHIAERSGALTRACEAAGRDPDAIARTAQALMFVVSDAPNRDPASVQERLDRAPMPAIGGTVGQLRDAVAAYAEAGVDELIVPDRTLGRGGAKLETMDKVIEEVAPAFR